MAGKSSNLLGASSSASKKQAKQEEKRKQSATRAEQAKKPRPFQLINFTAPLRGSGTAVPGVHRGASNNNVATTTAHHRGTGSGTAVPGVHRGASNNMATAAFPFPMAGVNGAAPLWSTAAALGAASRAAALTSSALPATAGANNGPAAAHVVIAPAPVLQPPPVGSATSNAAAATFALPAASRAATGVVPPLVLAQAAGAGSAGQLVSLPVQFVGYHPTCRANGLLPVPAVGIPLAAALDKIESGALGRMLSALMPMCNPPLWPHQSKTGALPPWWPTGSEDWWQHELLDQLEYSVAAPVPFASSYSLKKAQKVAVLVAIVKHLAPEFDRIANAVRSSGKLSGSEKKLWHCALNNEIAKFTRQVFVLLPPTLQQQQAGGAGGSAGTDPSAGTGSVVVVRSGNAATSDSCGELQVTNLPPGASVSMATPADGSRGKAIAAAAGLVAEKEQRSDSDGVGVVLSATDAPPAGDDGRVQPVNNFPAGSGGDGSPDKQGAAVAAAAPTTGHVSQEAGGPSEMTTMQQLEQGGGVPGDEVAAAAAAEDEQVHPVVVAPNADAVAPAIEEEAQEDRQWWCSYDELNRMFAEFESFGDAWYE